MSNLGEYSLRTRTRTLADTCEVHTVEHVDPPSATLPIHSVAIDLDSEDRYSIIQLLDAVDRRNHLTGEGPQGEQLDMEVRNHINWAIVNLLIVDIAAVSVFISDGSEERLAANVDVLEDQIRDLIRSSLAVYEEARDNSASLVDLVASFPAPLFGSPPETFRRLVDLVALPGGGIIIVGTSVATGRPILAIASTAGALLFWFGRPVAKIARRSLAERTARALKTELREEDLT